MIVAGLYPKSMKKPDNFIQKIYQRGRIQTGQTGKTGEALRSVTENHEFWEIPCFFSEVVIEYCLFERLAQLVRALR